MAPAPPPAPAATTRGRAALDVLLQLVGRLASLALGMVVTVVLVRELGIRDTGVWTTLLAINTIATIVADLGLQQVAVREAAREPDAEPAWLGALVVLRGLISIPIALASFGAVLAVTGHGDERLAGLLMALTLPIGTPLILSAAFQLRVRNDRSAAIVLLNSILWTAGVVVVALRDGGLVAFAATMLGAAAITTVAQVLWLRRIVTIDLSGARRHGIELLRTGAVVGAALMLTIAYARIDQVLVLHYAGERGAGLYGTAYLLLDRASFAPVTLMATLYPMLSGAWPADPHRSRRIVRQGFEYLTMASLPAFAFTLVASEPLLRRLFGEQFTPAAPILPVLFAAFVFICEGYLVSYVALVVGRQGRFVWLALGTLVLNVAANMLLLPRYGYEAAAWVTLGSEALVLAVGAAIALPPLGLELRPGRIPRIAAASALMALAVWALKETGLGILGLLAAAGAVYAVALLGLGGVDPRDLALLRRRPVPEA